MAEQDGSKLLDELSILLWNIWCLPGPLSDNLSRTRALNIPAHLLSNDVILLNEAFTHKAILTSALDATHPYNATLPRRSYFWPTIFDSGLMIFSKYPIVETASIHYASRARIDRFAGKGALMARIDLSSERGEKKETIDVYATHMQAGNSSGEQASRRAQSEQLAAFINATSQNADRVVLGGDMNMGPLLASVHYASEDDAKNRTESYISLRESSGLKDVEVIVPGKEGDINRFLSRGVEVLGIEYLEVPCITDGKGKGCKLSDSDIVRLRVAGFERTMETTRGL